MLKMALPNGIKTKLIGEKSIQKQGRPAYHFFWFLAGFSEETDDENCQQEMLDWKENRRKMYLTCCGILW